MTKILRFAMLLLALAVGAPRLHSADADEGFKPIFNGKDLSGWDGNPKFWSVKDGVITGQTTKENPTDHNTFLIWRAGKVDDFELHAKIRLVGGNSGIQYRSKEMPDWVIAGYQADFDADNTYSGILYEERGRGILANRGEKVIIRDDGKPDVVGSVGDAKKIRDAIKKEEWNDYVVIAHGNHLTHKINGVTTVDVVDEDVEHRAASGLLALQMHAGEPMLVQFKDLELKRLKLTENRRKIVLVAGHPSHGPGEHEFNAGVQLLDKCLQQQKGIVSTFYLNGWPKDPTAFDNADAILFYMDGGAGHPVIQADHIQIIDALAAKGVGIGFAHYAVEVPAGKGGEALQRWIGGYYEDHYSVNPMWSPNFQTFPDSPVTRGVKPFSERDEWYFNMRWAEHPEGKITQILVDTPSDKVRNGPYVYPQGPYKHIQEASGRPEAMMWIFERNNGGRGFGFTGGHTHAHWGDENLRKVVLNALVWIAKGDIPADGIESSITDEDLRQNLDPKGKKK
jgi:type 1 glutamine amidotransferase